MTTKIRAWGSEATLDDGVWSSDHEPLKDRCRIAQLTLTLPGYHPDPEYAEAKAIADQLGGEVVERSAPEPTEPGAIY